MAGPNTRMQSDRFAREIIAILTVSYAARSRRLMRNPLGHAIERAQTDGQSYHKPTLTAWPEVPWHGGRSSSPRSLCHFTNARIEQCDRYACTVLTPTDSGA